MKYDVLFVGASVVDPKNKVKGRYDIGVAKGKVVEIAPELDGTQAREIIDLAGYTVMPGVIDTHVHAGGTAPRQMAKAGVCTCLDMGDMPNVIKQLPSRGVGMNVAGLKTIGPYPDATPSQEELAEEVEKALVGGAIGIKIVGGHRPSTPEATAAMIEAANKAGAYVAFHCGTTRYGSNLDGLLEAVELAGDNCLHIAHVNSYLRGMIKDPVEECLIGLNAIQGKKNLVSESYLAIVNGTGAKIGPDGLPQSHVTRNCLKMGGYTPDKAGLEQAIRDGYCMIKEEQGGETVFVSPERGLKVWNERNTDAACSFPVNQPMSTVLCALKKDEQGKFIVDAIGTDGGSTPRNVAVEHGLSLVRYKALTMDEFVLKTSTVGAIMLGMPDKGHLGVGADADITVLDMEKGLAVMTIVAGKVIMAHGVIYGKGGTVVCTAKGTGAAEAAGQPWRVVDPREMLLYTKRLA